MEPFLFLSVSILGELETSGYAARERFEFEFSKALKFACPVCFFDLHPADDEDPLWASESKVIQSTS